MKTRTQVFLILGLVLGSILIAVIMVWTRPRPPRIEAAPAVPVVDTRPAEGLTGSLPVFGSGTVRPTAEVDLAFQVSGQVVFVHPSLLAGGRVQQGQELVRLDPADYDNRVQQARADVAQQEVGVLQASEEAAIARTEYEQFLARQRRLGSGDTISAASALLLREPQLAAARAALARAQAQLSDAELAQSRTSARAPFDALVRTESVDVGAYVGPGQSLARLYASDEVEVVVPLTDRGAALIPGLWQLRAGDGNAQVAATVSIDYGGVRYSWTGYVDRAEATLDEQSRTIDVVVRVPNPLSGGESAVGTGASTAPPLLVGGYAEVEIAGIEVEDYTRIPRSALRPGDEVWAVEGGSILRIVPVEVLQRSGESVLVRGALSDGQPVVIGGVSIASDGMAVRMMTREDG